MESKSIQEQQVDISKTLHCIDQNGNEELHSFLMRIEELQEANLQLESLLLSISHDLRNPLTTVVAGSSYLLSKCAGRLERREQTILESVSTSSQRMAGMIEALLGMCSVAEKKLVYTKVDLSSAAAGIAAEFQQREPLRDVTFRIEKDIYVWGDSRLFQVVLINLLDNSWKYSARVEHATIEFGADTSGPQPVFFVSDNGIGFDAHQAESLFTPFKRLNEDFEGTGIGLATVRRIINRLGGKVWAEGNPGKGATFSFTMPSVKK